MLLPFVLFRAGLEVFHVDHMQYIIVLKKGSQFPLVFRAGSVTDSRKKYPHKS